MPCCKAEKYGWCKDLPVIKYKDEEGKEFCVFHAPKGKKEIPLEEFNELVFKEINKAKSEGKSCHLSGTVFEGNIYFGQFDKNNSLPDISFRDATFTGKADFFGTKFKSADFSGVKFNGEVDFSGATFIGKTNFAWANFNKKARFIGTKFTGDIFIRRAASFRRAKFREKTNFSNSRFRMLADFAETEFRGEAKFSGARFGKGADANFSGTIFSKEAIFLKTKFSGKAFLTGATFSEKTYFEGDIFAEGGSCTSLTIKEKIRLEGVNLKKVSFLDTDLRKIDFINCIWPKKLIWGIKPRRDVLYDELALFGNIKDDDEKDKNFFQRLKSRFKRSLSGILKRELSEFKKDISCDKEKIKKVEILYSRLKQKYKEEHNEPEVSNWHYGEKEMYRKGKRLRRMIPFTISNLYWFSSGYGEGPIRAGVVLLLLILIISVLSGLAGLSPLNQNPPYEITEVEGWSNIINIQNLWALVLNTLQCATFEKKPDFVPKTIYGASLKVVARILIPLQTALFALAVRNRFRR